MPKESDTEQLREGFEKLEKDILKSKELLETGKLAKTIDNLHQRIEINKNLIGILQGKVFDLWKTNPQETPVSSSEDDGYVLTSIGEYEKSPTIELFSTRLELIKIRKMELQASSGSFTYRIARLVFLDEEGSITKVDPVFFQDEEK